MKHEVVYQWGIIWEYCLDELLVTELVFDVLSRDDDDILVVFVLECIDEANVLQLSAVDT